MLLTAFGGLLVAFWWLLAAFGSFAAFGAFWLPLSVLGPACPFLIAVEYSAVVIRAGNRNRSAPNPGDPTLECSSHRPSHTHASPRATTALRGTRSARAAPSRLGRPPTPGDALGSVSTARDPPSRHGAFRLASDHSSVPSSVPSAVASPFAVLDSSRPPVLDGPSARCTRCTRCTRARGQSGGRSGPDSLRPVGRQN